MSEETDISLLASEALISAIDERVDQKTRSRSSTHQAEVTKIDADGTTWVHIYGGSSETPLRSMTSAANVGDIIEVTITENSARGGGNVTSPAASQTYVEKSNSENAKLIAGVMNGLLEIDKIIARKVSVEDLNAVKATIQQAVIEYIQANTGIFDNLVANKADANFANVIAANVDMAKIRELFARTGWFDEITVTGDASITGQLKGVLIDGDTARFSNIYADALKLLGEDGLYHALNISGLSEDDARALVSAYGEALDGGLHGSHIIAESVTATQIDVSSLIAAMLLTQFVQIGASAGTHIEARGDRFSFFHGGSGWSTLSDDYLYPQVEDPTGSPADNGYYELVDGEYVPSTDTTVDSGKTYYRYNVSADTALPGEVAYIAIDPTTRESTFYMTRSVVVKDLRFGDWMWYGRRNRNMSLKWMGGIV